MILYDRNTNEFSRVSESENLGIFVMSATEEEFREAAADLAHMYGNDIVFCAGQVYTASQKSFLFHEQKSATKFETETTVVDDVHKERVKRPVKERVIAFLKGASRVQSENSIVKDIVSMYFAGIPLKEIKQKTDLSDALIEDILEVYAKRGEKENGETVAEHI